MSRVIPRPLLVLLVVSAAVGGCHSPPARPRVVGRVLVQGEPAASATLALHSDDPEAFFTQRIQLMPDGTFDGVVPAPGTFKVAVEEPLAVQESRAKDARPSRIPTKYRTRETTDLVWPVGPGDNRREFDLKE